MIPPQVLAIGGGVLLTAGLLGGWTIRDWKADSDALQAVEARDKLRDKMQGTIDEGSTKYEQWRASLQPARLETRNTIREIFRDAPPVPAECAAPDAFVGVLDREAGRANAAAAGQFGAVVPVAATPTATVDRPRSRTVGN